MDNAIGILAGLIVTLSLGVVAILFVTDFANSMTVDNYDILITSEIYQSGKLSIETFTITNLSDHGISGGTLVAGSTCDLEIKSIAPHGYLTMACPVGDSVGMTANLAFEDGTVSKSRKINDTIITAVYTSNANIPASPPDVNIQAPLPASPQDLRGSSITHNSVILSWVSDDMVTSYQILCKTLGAESFSVCFSISENSYAVTGLEPDTQYVYSVKAVSSAGISIESNSVTVRTDAIPVAIPVIIPVTIPVAMPDRPQSISYRVIDNYITITWRQEDNTVTHYAIYEHSASESEYEHLLDTDGPVNAVSFEMTFDTTSFWHKIRIVSVNDSGHSIPYDFVLYL